MALLVKLRSATLMEALVATILLLSIFIIASLVLNNLLLNALNGNTNRIDYRLNELQYEFQNSKIKLPYNEIFEDWNLKIYRIDKSHEISIVAENLANGKRINRICQYEE